MSRWHIKRLEVSRVAGIVGNVARTATSRRLDSERASEDPIKAKEDLQVKIKQGVCCFLLLGWSLVAAPNFAIEVADLGQLDFPNSGSAEAQQAFVTGVLLLHSFEFEDSAEAFRQAQEIDPDFALAYWGEAMSHNHPLWRQQDRDAALEVLGSFAPSADERFAKAQTQRERDYLATLEVLYGEGSKQQRDRAYSAAMGQLSQTYPDDLEAKAFYALSILGTTGGERDFATFMHAASVAEEVFAANSRHPGAAHYLIHSYDDPVHAPLGLRAARVYAGIAPAASHAQHMISHIYVALGRWADSIAANEQSFAVSVDRARAKNLGVDARNFHALHWLQYSHLQLGQFEQAWALTSEMDEYAIESGKERALWYQAAFRAGWVVATGAEYLEPLDAPAELEFGAAVQDQFGRGYAALNRGDWEAATAASEEIARLRKEAKPDDVVESALNEAQVLELELASMVALGQEDEARALELLGQATAIENQLPLEYGPPDIVKPSFELLGDVLLKLGRASEAQAAYNNALKRAPRRRQSLLGLSQAALDLGDQAGVSAACRELSAIYGHADPDLERPQACENG